MKRKIFVVAVILILLAGCAAFIPPPKVESKTTLVKDLNGAIISTSYERTVSGRSYRDPETALSVAEAGLLASYGPGGKSSVQESEYLGFIINDKNVKWNLTIKTKISGLTIFQADVPPTTKLKYNLRCGEYITVWTNGYDKYTNALKVIPYADVRTIIKKGDKEEEARGHWMTHLPQ